MVNVKPVQLGKNTRMSFSHINEVLDMPNLIEIQKNSYDWFLKEGLREVFDDVSGITDFNGNLVLDFVNYKLDEKPNYTVTECKERDATYAAALRVTARLLNKETGEIKESEVFMGDFPLMTPSGTFVINGAERVIVSQLVRSPGVYYKMEYDKTGKQLFSSTVIPNRGAWLEYENDVNDVLYVRIDKNRKLPMTAFIRALGLGTDEEIKEYFGEDERILATIDKDTTHTMEEGLFEVYRKLRPSEPPTVESAQFHLNGLFFDPRRYDLSRVGRYKYNKKLNLAGRITGRQLSRPIVNPATGEVMAEAGTVVSRTLAEDIDNAGVTTAWVALEDDKETKVISNGMVDIAKYVSFDAEAECGINERVRYAVLSEILEECGDDEEKLKEQLTARHDELIPNHIIIDDIFSSINYMTCLAVGLGFTDDIDQLGNRRIRSVGELLQNQFRIGFSRLERVIRERMTLQRRLSALGPGGLSRDRASFEVRDVHYTHYGRMCPIESPEGQNIGLISYLATFARINHYGFIEAPYRKIDKATGKVTDEVVYMTADVEDEFIVAQANEKLNEDNTFANDSVLARFKGEFIQVEPTRVDYMDISPRMVFSVATAMIPFLENDDANRALMGANMQRQAVPLLRTESPIVGTGMCERAGVVKSVSADLIRVTTDNGDIDDYVVTKFMRSNQSTCINQVPIVNRGDRVEVGDVLADGPAIKNGEIALGKNALIGFMTWEGYNYEDAVLLNEKIVRDDVYTSIHIEEYEMEARDTKLGAEEITRDIPNVNEDLLRDLDDRGIIRVGAEVHAGDILVGKVTPKGETELTAEERLLRAIFGEKAREVRDTSLRVPHGEYGTIVDVKVFTRDNCDELSPGVNKVVRCYIAQKRKISVGDKMAGRHGNKGVVSRILPMEEMPFLPDGTPLDIVLNPLGVPSRMNIGQVLEVHLGMAANALGWKIMTPVFDGAHEADIRECFRMAGMSEDGKFRLRDGRTGEYFDNPVTVGYMYYLKLHHLVDDKIHARSTGPYALVTQQPLGGKAQFGGQRFGEMEVWALEAYGAAYTLQEILTVKSDDVVGRVKTYEAIVKGQNVPKPGIPESFRVLIKELQALGLDIKVLDKDNEEIDLRQSFDDDDDVGLTPGDQVFDEENVATDGDFDGYSIENEDGEEDDFFSTGDDDEFEGSDNDLFDGIDDEF